MFTVCEYAGSLLLIVTGATLLFMAGVIVLVLMEGAGTLAHTLRKPKSDLMTTLTGVWSGELSSGTQGHEQSQPNG